MGEAVTKVHPVSRERNIDPLLLPIHLSKEACQGHIIRGTSGMGNIYAIYVHMIQQFHF